MGGATFYYGDGTKVTVYARRRWAETTRGPERWWGSYVADPGETVRREIMYARFSDGSEAEIAINPRNERCGRFVVRGTLEDSTTRPRPDI